MVYRQDVGKPAIHIKALLHITTFKEGSRGENSSPRQTKVTTLEQSGRDPSAREEAGPRLRGQTGPTQENSPYAPASASAAACLQAFLLGPWSHKLKYW